MKKAIPVIIAIVLMLIIGGVYGGKIIIDKLAYSNEQYDLNTFFEVSDDSHVAVIMQDKFMEFQARRSEGYCYFSYDIVQEYFNERFYLDETEGLVIYVEPLSITTAHIGESGIDKDGNVQATSYVPAKYIDNTLYLACDFVKMFTNYQYTVYEDPARMMVYTEWNPREIAMATKNTAIRYRGGIKSPILKNLEAGDKVTVLENMEEWSKVISDDGCIGYMENKRMESCGTEEPIPVNDYISPEFTSIARDYKINMAWHNIAGPAGNDTLSSYVSNTHDINVISPTWFGLADNDGNITDYASSAYVSTAHGMGMEVWALVSNFTTPDVDTFAVLSATSTRRVLINNLMNAAFSYGVDGINIDFEDLSVQTGQPFIQFIRELSVECRKSGIVLSVDNYVPLGNTDYYNRAEQGVYADYVVIMGYDEHYAGSAEAGSVAGIEYVTQGIQRTIEEVPASKVINGVPFYTRLWETTGADVKSQAVGMQMATQWVKDHNMSSSWDEATCQNYAESTSGDTKYQVWLEDAESIGVKLNVMDTYGCAGVASWCLGFETPDIWDTIASYLNK